MKRPRNNTIYKYFGVDHGLRFIEQFGFRNVRVTEPLDWHMHTGYEFVFVLGGHVVYETDGGNSCQLTGGQYSLMTPRTSHRARDSRNSPCKLLWIVFTPTADPAARNMPFRSADMMAIADACQRAGNSKHTMSPRLMTLLGRLRELSVAQAGSPSVFDQAALRLLICQILVEASAQLNARPAPTVDESVTEAVALLKSRVAEPLRISAVASQLGMSTSSLYRAFKAQLGQTPNDYMQRLRIEAAKEQLRQTQDSCTAIAMNLGFSSSQYFSQTFKRYTGRSPLEFRTSTDAE